MTAKRRRGGPPVYTAETAARRAAGKVTLRLSPEAHALLLDLCRRWDCGKTEAVTGLLKAEALDLAQHQAAQKAAR